MKTKLITASEARSIHGRIYKTTIADFNKMVNQAISDGKNFIHLHYTTTHNFIDLLKKAGYECSYVSSTWLITWKRKDEHFFP